MKSLLFFGLLLFSLNSCKKEEKILTDDTPIRLSKPIEEYLISRKLDTDGVVNGQVKYGIVKTVDSLDIVCLEVIGKLEGLEYFENLEVLRFRNFDDSPYRERSLFTYVPVLDTLDVSKNKNLISLDCSGYVLGVGAIESPSYRFLKLGDNRKLTTLVSNCNLLTTIDLSTLTNLEILILRMSRKLLTLDLCNNKKLKRAFITRSPESITVSVPANNSIEWVPPSERTPLKFIDCK
jgi:hypothetical protein